MDLQRSTRITNMTLLGVALGLTLMASTVSRAEQLSSEKLIRTTRQVEVLVRSTARKILPPQQRETRLPVHPVDTIARDLHHETLNTEDRLVYQRPCLPELISLPPPAC